MNSEQLPLDFRTIKFERIQISDLKPNENGKGLSGKIQYLNDKGIPENFFIQSPLMQFPYGVSDYLGEHTNFSLSASLEEKVPIVHEFVKFLKKFDEFTLQYALKHAKVILGKNAEVLREDGTKGPITLAGIRMFHNSLIKEPKEEKKDSYSSTFSTKVYPMKTKDDQIIPDTYNFECFEFDGVTRTSTNIPHHSTGCMHYQPASLYAVNGKFGITNVLKKVVLTSKGGNVQIKYVPNMYGEQPPPPPVDIYDDAVEKAVQEAEKKRERDPSPEPEEVESQPAKPAKKSKSKK